MNLRIRWVMRWSRHEKQYRFFRIMWEYKNPNLIYTHSFKISVSLKYYVVPWITFRESLGGIFV